jgi:hypothetical protein
MPKPLEKWELILCGPMLRRVTPNSVSVFVALKHPRQVKLTVAEVDGSSQEKSHQEETIALGQYLHVCLVTLKLSSAEALVPYKIYGYNLTLTAYGTRDKLDKGPPVVNLKDTGLLHGEACLGYEPGSLPSFALPPTELTYLKLIHGSCRKPHGQRRDALPIVDTIIAGKRSDAYSRPHQLFLTGDQIYADDVAEPLLAELTPTAEMLLGWPTSEQIPGMSKAPRDILPGDREPYIKPWFGTGEGHSHLITLGEYYAMYLFTWSDELWPNQIPSFAQLSAAEQKRYGEKRKAHYDEQVKALELFRGGLGKVRRLLANVPTYMMFDDHDVTDDWFLDKQSVTDYMNVDVPHRLVTNALSAFAVFQAWGNTPEQFEAPPAQPPPGSQTAIGRQLLGHLSSWKGENNDTFVSINSALLSTVGDRLRYDFEVEGPAHQVIVLDTRTQRGYPSNDNLGQPDLLSAMALKRQIVDRTPQPPSTPKRITVVVSPTPVFGYWLHEGIAEIGGAAGKSRTVDREAWLVRHRRAGFENFLKALVPFSRVMILSGDVHYAFSQRIFYWDQRQTPEKPAVFVQFTSSALKNEDAKTRGGSLDMLLRAQTGYLGWEQPGSHLAKGATAIEVGGTPAVTAVPNGDAVRSAPQWRYVIEQLIDHTGDKIEVPVPPLGSDWLANRLSDLGYGIGVLSKDQMRWSIGLNNVAEISFVATKR